MGTLSEEVYICFPSQDGFTRRGNNLLLFEQFVFSRVNRSLKGLYQPEKQTGNHESCSPYLKIAGKHGGVPIHLKHRVRLFKTNDVVS